MTTSEAARAPHGEPAVLIVSHTHWDREWYRTFEQFRARLVDGVDRVLDLLEAEPDWCFQLDGQSVVVEDYLAIRPHRSEELRAAVLGGRLALGPWYVQPDSLLPSGEAHIRNLLEGRRVAEAHGGCARVAYTPDSFGHPAQLPQLFAGFGLGPFVHWRGNGDELDRLGGDTYRWVAPDGTAVTAHLLLRGYFAAAGLHGTPEAAAARVEPLVRTLADAGDDPVVLMAGADHSVPDAGTGAVARALAARTGLEVRPALLDELIDAFAGRALGEHRGELRGGRLANLLPGVWSTRTALKLANRDAEARLEGWAEPFAAIAGLLGGPDERPALRQAWRTLLVNQAHDSICGCSQDRVHEQMATRLQTTSELADQTTSRLLDRIAGLDAGRQVPWTTELDLAVFNPSPYPRTDVVRVPLDGVPLYRASDVDFDLHPLVLAAGTVEGFTVDGVSVRAERSTDPGRVRMLDEWPAMDVEVVVADVPAFGWRRVHLAPGPAAPDVVDDGREIEADGIRVEAEAEGTLAVTLGGRTWTGLLAIEDRGDRGDTYDFEPVLHDVAPEVVGVRVRRITHASGIQRLVVERDVAVPGALTADRDVRSEERVLVTMTVEARVAPGVARVDLVVDVDNRAQDHRLRLLLPTGAPVDDFVAGTTLDTARRSTRTEEGAGWVQPPVPTFPLQGWVAANGLTVAAPGLAECEVTEDGVIALTLVRAVGFLSRMDLRGRPMPAGPGLETPGAQCLGRTTARLALLADADPNLARDAELGLTAAFAGDAPLAPAGTTLLEVEPRDVVVSALKPTDEGDGVVLRLRNPHDDARVAVVQTSLPVRTVQPIRLDETPDGETRPLLDGRFEVELPPHALRSVLLRR